MLTMRRPARLLGLALMLTVACAAAAHAQSPLGIGTAEPAFKTTGLFGGFFSFVNMEQQRFYHTLTQAIKGMRENPWQLWSLIGLSFAYGVFHAAGPGHGKAVISSYMIANETELKRGVLLSFLSSMMQGGVAILLVGAAYLVLRGSSISMTQATHFLEVVSYALIAAFGGWLLFRKLRGLHQRRLVPAMAQDANHHHSAHEHDHGHQTMRIIPRTTAITITAIMATAMDRARSATPAVMRMRPIRRCSRATASPCGKPGRRSSPSACGPAQAR
jgi:nickel/cobalt exporter